MYKAIIFDIDGTITDSEPVVARVMQAAMRDLGREYTIEEMLAAVGMPTELTFQKFGFTDIDTCMQAFGKYQNVLLRDIQLFDGMWQTLEALRARGIPLGIVTSETRVEMQTNFNARGLAPFFKATVSADDVERRKPHPDPLLLCLELMGGLDPADVLFVGDTLFDLRCANAAGVDFGLAAWGAHTEEGFERATHILRRPDEILSMIRQD